MTEPETRLSRRDAEHLLDAPAAHDNALGWALSAMGAPTHPDELRREDATVTEFHRARLTPPPATRTGFVSPTRLGARAAVHAVVATAAVVAMASGGFALAGSVDLPGLPTLPGQASDRATEAVAGARGGVASGSDSSPGATSSSQGPTGSSTSTFTSASTSSSPTGPGTVTTAATTATPSDDGSASPTPSLRGLCKAFQASDRSHGASLDSTAFAALAAAAGGADQVATYCVALVGAPETPSSTPTPTPTGKPTDKPTPTGPPTDKPTGSPTDKPTGSPTDKPTGSPTGKPTGSPTDTPTG